MSTDKVNINAKTIMHYAIMIAIMGIFYVIPGFGGGIVTPYGMKIVGVFIALVYGWTFIGMLVPSLIGVFGIALAGVDTTQQVFMNTFYNANILMMIIGSLGFASLSQTNASDWVFGKILSTNFAKKSGILTVFCIFTIILVLGALGMGILIQFVLFPIMNDFLKKCGYEKGEKFSNMFLLGFLMSSVISIGIFPFYSWGLMICGSLMSISGYAIPLGTYMLLSILIYVIFLVTYPLLMKVMGCDFSKLQNVDVLEVFNVDADTKLNTAQKLSLGGLLLFLALVMIGSFVQIPIVQSIYGKIGVLGLMLVYWMAMVIIKIDGKPLLNMRQASADMSWDLCILMAVALVLSTAMTSAESGMGTWLAMVISPIVMGVGQVAFIAILAIILIVLTNLANNIAVVFILINIVGALYTNGLPINMLATSLVLAIGSCAVAYFTPASSLPGAILHGAEMTETKDLYVINWIVAVYEFVLLMVVLIPVVLLGIGM